MTTFTHGTLKLLSCLLLCLLTAFLGGWLSPESFHPFALVWTPLYILMGLSLWLLLSKTDKPKPGFWPYFWFGLQLILSLGWSPAFFFYDCSLCGALILLALMVVIGMTIYTFHKYVPVAAYLLVPYFLWVLFLAITNLLILAKG